MDTISARMNPVLARELRTRARRTSTIVLLTIFLLLLIGLAAVVWGSTTAESDDDVFNAQRIGEISRIGRQMFEWTVFAELMLVCFLVPGFTAASISGERERQTLIPVQVTLMSPRQIVVGKLASSLAYTLLMLVLALPIVSLAYGIGGVSLTEVGLSLIAVTVVALTLGAMSIACSAMVRRTGVAVVLAYTGMLTLLLGTLIATVILGVVSEGGSWRPALAPNPLVFVADLVTPNQFEGFFGSELGPLSGTSSAFDDSTVAYWIIGAGWYAAISAVALWRAVRSVTTPAERER